MQRAMFKDANDALSFQFDVMVRMASLIAWLAIAMTHLAALVLFLCLAWWFQWEPTALGHSFRQLVAARPVATFLAAGGSVLGLVAGYWKLTKWAHRASARGWIARYLVRI